jgi:hypothetical protein
MGERIDGERTMPDHDRGDEEPPDEPRHSSEEQARQGQGEGRQMLNAGPVESA